MFDICFTVLSWQVGRRKSEVGRMEEEQAACSLGHVAHCVALLAAYLDVPLRYPVQPAGSYSFLRDTESMSPNNAFVLGKEVCNKTP